MQGWAPKPLDKGKSEGLFTMDEPTYTVVPTKVKKDELFLSKSLQKATPAKAEKPAIAYDPKVIFSIIKSFLEL